MQLFIVFKFIYSNGHKTPLSVLSIRSITLFALLSLELSNEI